MSTSGDSKSNGEAFTRAEMMGMKVYQRESGLRGTWRKTLLFRVTLDAGTQLPDDLA